jgi:hypothetical protein
VKRIADGEPESATDGDVERTSFITAMPPLASDWTASSNTATGAAFAALEQPARGPVATVTSSMQIAPRLRIVIR